MELFRGIVFDRGTFPWNSLPLWNFFRGIVFHRNLRKVETDDSVSIECYRPKKCLTSADKNVVGMSTFQRRKNLNESTFYLSNWIKVNSVTKRWQIDPPVRSPGPFNWITAAMKWQQKRHVAMATDFIYFFWKSKTGNAPNWISSVVSRHSSSFVFSHFHARQCGRPHQPTVVMATDLIQLADVWIFWWNLNKFA